MEDFSILRKQISLAWLHKHAEMVQASGPNRNYHTKKKQSPKYMVPSKLFLGISR